MLSCIHAPHKMANFHSKVALKYFLQQQGCIQRKTTMQQYNDLNQVLYYKERKSEKWYV